MATYITVIEEGNDNDPYIAVQGCNHRQPLENARHYNSQFSQSFGKANSDLRIGTKTITNIRTGNKIQAAMFELTATLAVDDAIKVVGCEAVALLGFTTEIANLITEWNDVRDEKIKLKKAKKKLKESK